MDVCLYSTSLNIIKKPHEMQLNLLKCRAYVVAYESS